MESNRGGFYAILIRGKVSLFSVHHRLMEGHPFTFKFQDPLDKSSAKALQTPRPILTHLNADTSWLLQLPCPQDQQLHTGRSRYNIVIDPWFQGTQVDFAAWFSKQWHAIRSCTQNFQELNDQLENSERFSPSRATCCEWQEHSAPPKSSGSSMIDAVIISHEYTDHCHRETLLELDPATPVLATRKAVALVKSWKHFNTVSEIPVFAPLGRDQGWKKYSVGPLPDWVGLSRIVSKSDPGYLHSAILLTFRLDHSKKNSTINDDERGESSFEGVVYTPHGIHAQDLCQIHSMTPSITVLALLHGLDEVALSRFQQLNLGGHNGLKAQRICKAKYWVSTHDEVKNGTGLVALLLRRKAIPLHEAIKQEKQDRMVPSQGSWSTNAPPVVFAALDNGESILLE